MMERNYPSSSFSDPLAPAAQTAAWAYERAGLKPSLSYGAGPTEADLLHRQAYTAAQLPSYSAAHHPAGLAGLFDTSIHGTGINTTETSVMNFLSAIESRTSSGATLLPQFRASSWQTGMHSSADLFVTGALPTSGTFPPTSALSAYQHPSSFSSRNFATTPTLTLQDGTFSAASNGLLSHDPILQLKASQCTIPTALTFDRLGSTVLTSSLPPQSSTYRSAQESAPHLLQPQFSLLPSALAGAQQASQAYSTAVFAGSTASIERALQRECSVIKHHQRPSSTQSVQAQLAGSHHSLQTYLSSASGITLQDTPRQSSLSCSPLADITQVSNGGLQQKASRVTVELAQSYTSSIPSSGYPLSSVKGKNCSTKPPPMSTKTSKPQSVVLPVQTQSYTKSAQSQSSVISSQAQIYSTAQLPSLLSVSQSQTYVSTQSPNLTTVSDSQSYSSLKSEDLLYKAINSFSGQSQAIPSASPTLRHSPGQQHSLPPVSNESYSDQARNLSSVTRSQSYTPSQSQSLSPVSHSPINYTSQSHILSASPSICYTSGQNLVPSSSLAYSSSPGVQNVSTASPTRNYISLPSSQSSQTQGSPSPQSQTFLPTVQSPFASPSRPQTLHNSRLSSEVKSYARKKKLQTDGYSPSKQEAEFPMQDLQTLQQHNTIEASNQRLGEGEIGDQESAYRVSKADDRYYSSGVIRSSSRLDDQELGLLLQRSKKDERMVSSVTQLSQQIAHSNSVASQEIKHSANLMQTSHDREHTKERTQQNEIINKANETKTEENTGSVTSNSAQIASHGLRLDQQLSLPNTHSLLESDCDLQILQQSMLQSNFEQTKISTPMPQIQRLQQTGHPFLQMDSHVHKNVGPSQQQIQPQNLEVMKMDIVELPKPMQHQERTTKDNFRLPNQHDTKSQFVSLSSMCFPESMLLTDEKNILSNVDDILAATAAACGVTTQEFAKAASSSGDIAVENSNSSKSHYRSDVGLVSQNFVTSQAAIVKNENVNTDSLNSSQMSLILQPASTVQPENQTFDKTPIDMSVQNMLSDIGSQVLRPDNEEQSATSATINRQSNTNQGIEEDNGVQNDVFSDPTGQNLASQDTSAHEETATSDNDHVDDRTVTANQTNLLLTETQTCRISGSVVDGVKRDITESNISSNRGITLPSADENANHKDNNDAQVKRTISKGIDISLPCSPADIAESYFDSFQHQERIRQKIKEVEEQQPEVKCGFIGSFLDFLKGEPKVAPPPKVPNRTKRSAAPILRAPILQHVPFKNLPLMNPVAPLDSDSTESQNMMEDGFKKKVETLPSFSSSDEDSGGGRDLQKSISTALSALEDTSDKKNKSGQAKTSAPALRIQSSQRITHSFLPMDGPKPHSNGGQCGQPLHRPQSSDVVKMGMPGPPKPLQQKELTTEHIFKHPNQHDSKSQCVSFGSVCFPESMLHIDKRNICSNMNDISATTTCGVTAHESVKAASSNGNLSVDKGADSKPRFQSDVRYVTPGFTTLQAAVAKHDTLNAVHLSNSQKSLNLSPVSKMQSKDIAFDKTHNATSDQNVPSDMGSPALKPGQKEQVHSSDTINRHSSTNPRVEENDVYSNAFNSTRSSNFSSPGSSLEKETTLSDKDFNVCVEKGKMTANQTNVLTPVHTDKQLCDNPENTADDGKKGITQGYHQKNQEVEQFLCKYLSEDENANQKQAEDGLPIKRQISKGIDISLPYTPDDIADSYFDSFHHQERIREKIKEVEQQLPEVKSEFIGSFLDFLKDEPRHLFTPPTANMPNQISRPTAPILRAPILQHVAFTNLPLMTPVAPLDISNTEKLKKVENRPKIQLETFSSSGEDSGGDRYLRKSISTALSALDATSEKKIKSESGKVTAAPVVKQETPCTSPPAIKVEEIPKAIETPKQPVFDGQLAKSQGSVAFEGSTEDEQSDSGGEGMFRERDEFVVKIEDMDALKLALNTGTEPPAIWKVQKALLQKFVPEVRDGQRQYSATNSYLGYFGDAKTKYKRVYAKFIENANKKEYVRVCSRKPRIKPQPVRPAHTKGMVNNKAQDSLAPKNVTTKVSTVKSKGKQPKIKAEPPPKKRKTWKEEFSSSHPDVTPEVHTGADPPPDQLMPVPEQHTTATEQSPPSQIDPSPALIQQQQPSSKQLIPAVSQPSPVPKQSPSASNQSLPATKELLPDQKQLPPSPKEPQLSTKQPPVPKRARPPPKRVRPPPKRARQAEVLQPLLTEKQDLLQPEKPEPLPSEKQELTPAEKEEHQQAEKLVPSTPVKADTLTTERLESSSSEKQLGLPLKQSPLTPNPTSTAPKEPQTTPEPLLSLFTARSLRTRAMKETFKSYMELLVSVALDAETMQALENSNDELLLPSMRKIDGMLNESQKKLLDKLNLVQSHKNALESFPELTVNLRENKSRKGPTSVSKIKVNGKTYNKKTLQNCKTSNRSSQEFTVKPERTHLCSLYHSLHHFKYHMYLTCKDEISTVLKGNADLGQEQIVQLCMKNMPWVEDLFEKFGELLSDVQEKCS
ncbi:glutamine and serine-rich protein 1 isoform X1 [Ambystoma mexicanum]|uniref:glutamine and serine-rich protein 1 isoform X1 n=1 Tax=Ambystoma mexicanum TaxID=8296 RepID=UPI0037E83C7E